jgi:glyceraldehyde 3-phosphate dehydrogenase
MKVAINGLGRIGRLVFRAAIERQEIDIVALNSPGNLETICHLINYDSIHGRFPFSCRVNNNCLIIDDKEIPVFHQKDPSLIAWEGIDVVLECSGKFNTKDKASAHFSRNVKKIIVSAPCENADKTIIFGVNQLELKLNDNIISIGSCTTNALVPILKILHDNFIITNGYATTIHSYTGDQNIVDNSHNDLRRARSASMSMIPTKTGAASAIALILPELTGKINGSAIRVPTANVSLIDFSFSTQKNMDRDLINNAMSMASSGYMKNIVGIAEAKLVSIDFNHTNYSSIFDPFETKIVSPNFARILSWYDNEWAFAQRLLDCCNLIRIV